MKTSTETESQPTHLALVPAQNAPSGKTPPPAHAFTLRLRSRLSPEQVLLSGETPEEAVDVALNHDVSEMTEPIMLWSNRDELLAMDLDRPDDADPVLEHHIPELFPEYLPRPLAAWVTHGGGLRALFCGIDGESSRALAGVWYAFAPLGAVRDFTVEAKTDSRHPSAPRGAEWCSRVYRFQPSANVTFPEDSVDRNLDDPVVQAWLEKHALEPGRHEQHLCPWCGGGGSSKCNPCVVVDETGVRCYRCGESRSWGVLAAPRLNAHSWKLAAQNFVHIAHQEQVMLAQLPHMPKELTRPAWDLLLRHANAHLLENDPDEEWAKRIEAAGSRKFDVVRSSGGAWLSAATLLPRQVSAANTISVLPWTTTKPRIDQALSSEPLPGFVGITPVPCSVVLAPHMPEQEGIVVRRPRGRGEPPPVDLGAGAPVDEVVQEAWGTLEVALPGLSRGYLASIIVIGIVGQYGTGTPPNLVVTGPSGSGKNSHARLGTNMLGRKLADITLRDPRDTTRQIGLALERGESPLFIDEIGREKEVYERLQALLRLNSETTFRALYANERSVVVDAPVILAGSTLPRPLVSSQEMNRRSVAYQLYGRAKSWEKHGDVARLRCNARLRPHLDVITASVWWKLHASGANPDWRKLCFEEYGAVPLDQLDSDGSSAVGRDEAIRTLYEIYRSAKDSALTKGTRWAGWLPCEPGTAANTVLGELVDLEGSEKSQFIETEELKRLDLTAILGFSVPRLRLLVHRRRTWILKFDELGVLKGQGVPRSQLPPAVTPQDDGGSHGASGASSASSPDEETVL